MSDFSPAELAFARLIIAKRRFAIAKKIDVLENEDRDLGVVILNMDAGGVPKLCEEIILADRAKDAANNRTGGAS